MTIPRFTTKFKKTGWRTRKFRKSIFILQLLFCISFSINSLHGYSQIDSLKNALLSAPSEKQSQLLMMISQQYLEIDPAESENYALQAITCAEQSKNISQIAEALQLLGKAKFKKGEYEIAAEYFLKAIQHLEMLGNKKAEEAKNHKYLGMCYESMVMTRKALEHYEIALSICRELDDPTAKAWLYHSVGMVYRHLNDNKTSYSNFKKAMHLFDSLNDRKGIESLSFGFALIYYDWGWIEKSLEMYLNALQILESDHDSSGMGFVYSNIAGIYENYLDMEKCYEYNYKALDIFTRINHSEGMAYIYNNLGMTFFHEKKYDSAIVYFEKSLAISKLRNLDQSTAFSLNNLGEVYMSTGKMKLAKRYFDQSLAISSQIADELCLVTNWLSIGEYFIKMDEPKEAIGFFLSAIETAKKMGNLDFENQAYQHLSDAYKKLGDTGHAFHYFQLHSQVKDSLFREKSQKAIAEMNARYETELKEEHISRLNSENKLKSLELSQSKNLNLILVFTVFLITGFSLVVIKLYFQKQQAFKLLVKKNLESVENEQKCKEQTQNPESRPERDIQKLKQTIPNDLTHRILSDLKKMIEIDKVWLDPELNLNEVAKRLNTNTAYLSKVINEHLNTNFTTYINEHRVKEARRMLADMKYTHLTIEGISGLVGFNSKSAFNAAFRKFTGITPSMFQIQVSKLKENSPLLN